jgi:homoserine dehydrogenase
MRNDVMVGPVAGSSSNGRQPKKVTRPFPLTVLKFGSSVLRNDSDFLRAVHEIYRWVREGHRVIAVVSAMQNVTNELLTWAETLGAGQEDPGVAALLATGEAQSTALLALALARAGVPALALDEVRLGLRTHGSTLNAEPCGVDRRALQRALEEYPVVVVPGFVGRGQDGAISLLGRGGSDLSAIFLAQETQAERCRLLKDVNGIFEFDPARGGEAALRYRTVTWEEAARVCGRAVQRKALDFAEQHGRGFEIAALNSDQPSIISDQAASFYQPFGEMAPLRVGLLGAGTVGLGVYRSLAAQPRAFDITGIAVRRLQREDGTPCRLLTRDPWQVVESDCELVVELIGGLSHATELIAAALRSGKDVVTANKMVIAYRGQELLRIAEESGTRLLFSAAVGGVAPMLEQVREIAEHCGIRSLQGVVNGTTNFILDRLAEGASREEAVRAAQRLGLAEQDPETDLNGSDAAHKLVVLAHAAFGQWLHPNEIECSGIKTLDGTVVRDAADRGHSMRLVASLDKDSTGIRASVSPQLVDRDHAFAKTLNEGNCLEIQTEEGETVYVRGKGAGRWPATESVVADILDIHRAHANSRYLDLNRPMNSRNEQNAHVPLGD